MGVFPSYRRMKSTRYTRGMSSLYLSHFGFNKPPFQITPDLDFFFSGGRRGDILTALLHVATHDEAIITLVAEVGSGKTLLARLMITRLGPQVCTVYLANPCFSRDEIIAAIARDLGLTDLPDAMEGRLAALQQELLRRHALGQRVVLVIDEAHTMPIESLEEVRLLSNLETGQHKLIIILLADKALLAAYAQGAMTVELVHVTSAVKELPVASMRVDSQVRLRPWPLVAASFGAALLMAALAVALLGWYRGASVPVMVPAAVVGQIAPQVPVPVPAVPASVAVVVVDDAASAPMAVPASMPVSVPMAPAAPSLQAVLPASPASEPGDSRPTLPRIGSHGQAIFEHTQARLKKKPLHGYTIQLIALKSVPSMDLYLKHIQTQLDARQIYAQFSDYKGKTYMAVYFGDFASVADSVRAIDKLPLAIKGNRPMVRSWVKVQQE